MRGRAPIAGGPRYLLARHAHFLPGDPKALSGGELSISGLGLRKPVLVVATSELSSVLLVFWGRGGRDTSGVLVCCFECCLVGEGGGEEAGRFRGSRFGSICQNHVSCLS